MFNYITNNKLNGFKVFAHALTFIVILIVLFGSFGQIPAGERGVKTRFGKVVSMIDPGLYFKLPIIEKVTKMDVHTQSLIAPKEAPLSAASFDLQDTKLAVVVNYHIEPKLVADIFTQYGGADIYYKTVVDPMIVATLKAVASQFTAANQIQRRQEMSDKAFIELNKAFEGKNVAIEKADFTDVDFSESFTKAIEEKVTAVQNAEAAKNKLEQTKAEAQQIIVTAEAQAQAIKIQAQAINSQGGADYVALQELKYWNGSKCTTYCFSSDRPIPTNIIDASK